MKQRILQFFWKNKLTIILVIFAIVILVPFVINYLVAQPSYWKVAGDSNSWIAFWGTYIGAIGTFVMAAIALIALIYNADQLEILKAQNRPYLFPSIFKLIQWDYENKRNEGMYYLHVENHGTQIAKNIKVEISISDTRLLENAELKGNIEYITQRRFSLPAKGEIDFNLYFALPMLCPKGCKPDNDKIESIDDQWNFIEKLEKATITVTLSYDFYEKDSDIETEIISMKHVSRLATTTVEVLDAINHSIKELSDKFDKLANQKRRMEMMNSNT